MEVLEKHWQIKCLPGRDASSIKILQLTDMHVWSPADGKNLEWKTKGRTVRINTEGSPYDTSSEPKLIEAIIARTRPQIVVFTGDVIDCRAFHPDSPRDCWKAAFRAAIAPVVGHGIPWTFIPGNHDHEEGCPYQREDMLQVYSGEFPLCLSEGATSFNHSLTVGPGPVADASNTLRLWLFDTGGNNPDPKIQYDTVDEAAIVDFKRLSASLSPGCATAFAFHHIPMQEMAGLEPLRGHSGIFDAAVRAGMAPWWASLLAPIIRLLPQRLVVGSSKRHSSLFDALCEARIPAAFCGHDHHNDYVCAKNGLHMCYGRISSSSPPSDWEGDSGPLPFNKGTRFVEFSWGDGDGATALVETWVEEETGECPGSRIQLFSG